MADQLNMNGAPAKSDAEQNEKGKTEQKRAFIARAIAAVKSREQEFEKSWWTAAREAEKIYTADNKNNEHWVPYNILYSNTEVLLPSLYSATPRPDVRPRYKSQNIKPIPQMLERFLQVAADPASPGADTFDGAMKDAVLSALVPGMGYVRLRYYQDRAFPIVYESGRYDTLVWGTASRWAKVPWIAFKHEMTKSVFQKQFGKSDEDMVLGHVPDDTSENSKDLCTVYEFWDKDTRKIYFLSEQWRETLLREDDDPLQLENFFPTPGLLTLTMRNGKMFPIPLYNYYKQQAAELNRVSVRLFSIISAIRVRGVYNGLLGDDLKNLLASDEIENQLIAAKEAAMLAQSGGFDKHIWMLPTEKLIETAQQLYQARESIKQVIYELTGISDIIRGSSVASETATAQDLKNKWGTVRLRRMQSVVADYTRDLFRMSVDCGASEIPPEQWKEIIQLPEIPLAQEKQAAQQQLILEQQRMAMAPPPEQGQQPPQPDPKLLQQAQSPSLEELLEKIKSDMNRTFIVNIQTSSTVDLDTAADKQEVIEFMNGVGQMMPVLQGLGTLGPTGIAAAKAMLIAVSQRFKFGLDMSDVIAQIEAPAPQAAEGPSEEEKQLAQAETSLKLEEIAGKKEILKAELELKREEIAVKRQELQIKRQKIALDLQQALLNPTPAPGTVSPAPARPPARSTPRKPS